MSNVKPLKKQAMIHPPIDSILDAMSFQLARLTATCERVGVHHFGKVHNVSLNQWRILGLVSALSGTHQNNSRAVSSFEVRGQLFMDKGQFSRTLKQLTARDLLQTSASPIDARVTDLQLTEKGQHLHNTLLSFTAERNEQGAEVLTQEECEEFLRVLKKLSAHYESLHAKADIFQ